MGTRVATVATVLALAGLVPGCPYLDEDDCADSGGRWNPDAEACLHEEDFPAYNACVKAGRAWDYDRRRCGERRD